VSVRLSVTLYISGTNKDRGKVGIETYSCKGENHETLVDIAEKQIAQGDSKRAPFVGENTN